MVNFLPKFNRAQAFLNQIRDLLPFDFSLSKLKEGEFFGPNFKKKSYLFASILDLALILIIIFNGIAPAQRLIEPLVTPIQIFEKKIPTKNFAFAPGSSTNKLSNISFSDLDTLAFYDLPIDAQGDISTTSRGYTNLTSDDGITLIEKSKSVGTKFLVTVTLNQTKEMLKFLDNPKAQENLGDNLVELLEETDADGIALDFESQNNIPLYYKDKYTNLTKTLSERLKRDELNYHLAIVIPQGRSDSALYDLKNLASNSDEIMISATEFSVPELRNSNMTSPQYGFSSNEYWDKVGNGIKNISGQLDTNLSMETAWYGNGSKYPMYVPRTTPAQIDNLNDPDFKLTDELLDSLVKGVPAKARPAARQNIPYIVEALRNEGILNQNVLAYALATIEHETASTFEPLEEYSGRYSARRLGYEGGTDYFGRGFIQLTHLRNYKLVGQRIGLGDELVKNPTLASNPDVSAKVLAAFFRDNNIATLASKGNFVAARRPVNPDSNGRKVALLASKYEN